MCKKVSASLYSTFSISFFHILTEISNSIDEKDKTLSVPCQSDWPEK